MSTSIILQLIQINQMLVNLLNYYIFLTIFYINNLLQFSFIIQLYYPYLIYLYIMLKSSQYLLATEQVKLNCLKFYQWALLNHLKSVDLVIAEHDYYKKTYEQRQQILKAPSINYLCKTIILENTGYDAKFQSEFYPKYICVVFQYIRKFHSEKLDKFMKQYQNNNSQNKAGNKFFHYRLADQLQSAQLSGYDHNGVVPIMMKTSMPIIISHQIQKLCPQFFWLGGGHPIVKLRISFEEFKNKSGNVVFVGDITQ